MSTTLRYNEYYDMQDTFDWLYEIGGTDEYSNLVCVHKDVHKLIHATTKETIEKYTIKLQLNEKQLKKLNKYRKECNLFDLV